MYRFAAVVPGLPAQAWRLLAADALSAVGTGMTVPFLMVYLHIVCGLSPAMAGGVLACIGAVSVIGNPLGGWLADIWSAKATLLAGLVVASAGAYCWSLVRGPGSAFAAAAVSGLGVSMSLPAQATLLTRLVSASGRSSAYAVNNATLNVGLGAGGVIAALIVHTGRPDAYVTLFLADTMTFVVAAACVALVRTGAVPGDDDLEPRAGTRSNGHFARIGRDKVLVRLWLVTAALSVVGFSQFHAALPLLAVEYAGLPAGDLGLVFAANTVAVVVFQLLVLRALAGRRRTRAASLVGPSWAICWLLVIVSGAVEANSLTLALLIAGAVSFAVGETLVWPTLPAIVNDIAPERLRGRYNGAFSLTLTLGFVTGPLVSGFAVTQELAVPLMVGFVLACAASAGAALRLERVVPPHANLVPA